MACGCDGPSLGIGGGMSPGVGRMNQCSPRGGATGPEGGGATRAADRRLAPPEGRQFLEASSTSMAAGVEA
jgi:hypothetical protein